MKRFLIRLGAFIATFGLLPSCNEQYITYDGPACVMFADTLSICPALESEDKFPVVIGSMQKCDYDRTYGIEIVGQNSDAVYNWHYTLDSQVVTIPAGQTSAAINVLPIYENLLEDETPRFELQLVSQFNDIWSEEGKTTKVEIRKIRPFDIQIFGGYCRVTSTFFASFGHPIQRVFTCKVVKDEDNTLIFEDFFFDGYDIKVRFDVSDPLNPTMEMIGEQVIADTREAFGNLHGNNQILADDAPGYNQGVNLWQRKAETHLLLRVDEVGTVGVFRNLFTWVEDYEVE